MEIQSNQAVSQIKDEEKFKCGICEITSDTESLLANHFKTAHRKCNICDRLFARKNLAKHKKDVHELEHQKINEEKLNSNPKDLQCNLCEQNFTFHSSLAGHIASVHNRLKPHKGSL